MTDHPVRVQVVAYEVSCLPDDHPERHNFTLRVVRRGGDRWAVVNRMDYCLSSAGKWDYEPLPSSRTDEWKADHRFARSDAVALAEQAAPHLTIGPTDAPFIVEDMLHDDFFAARAERLGL